MSLLTARADPTSPSLISSLSLPPSLSPSLCRALGFDGKSLIHPKTVGEANKAFGPRPEELARAERVLQAWRDAQAHGEGKEGGRKGGKEGRRDQDQKSWRTPRGCCRPGRHMGKVCLCFSSSFLPLSFPSFLPHSNTHSLPPSSLPSLLNKTGLAVVDGQLIEILHVEEANRLLMTQRNIEAVEASSVHVQAGMRPHPATATTSDTTR
jgi:hypothetical protein